MKKGKLLMALVALGLAILACSNINPLGDSNINFNPLGDGSLKVETSLSLDLIQTALETAGNFDQVVGLTLEPRNGYIYVHADQVEIQGVTGNDVSYHLELSSSQGDLIAKITNVQSGNNALDSSHFESYNEQIAEILTDENGLEDLTNFESVSITPDGVSVVVIIETGSSN
ncbi:MAG: hypothetical protein JW757_10420 [Anaerolineales bacterium]|nr:hypothetical protein [Anaerolineales bacterium]